MCRSLPDLGGKIPPRYPQDIIDATLESLESHGALNFTKLNALRRCEFGQLVLLLDVDV